MARTDEQKETLRPTKNMRPLSRAYHIYHFTSPHQCLFVQYRCGIVENENENGWCPLHLTWKVRVSAGGRPRRKAARARTTPVLSTDGPFLSPHNLSWVMVESQWNILGRKQGGYPIDRQEDKAKESGVRKRLDERGRGGIVLQRHGVLRQQRTAAVQGKDRGPCRALR